MQMTLRLACLIGIALAGVLRFVAPHYHLTAEIVGVGFLITALVATVILDETAPAGISASKK
ncbi:hypothetical protein NKW53_08180 [Acetobacter orientalis]|uniref:Uncharacterized protein n=1 Tax=Acetobacter orientalis TaxID=146474 RepID=A0A252A466_9PROT|nr:hypothetical protein [Acetobacter orientalis]MCP1216038.1 hypothetical protein [Acetobacter orientalis]MCP1217802.1 hypothetical protein [Acetobacter orientalis]OUI84018.1 hypothetical protein HK12_01600 [Acetobacter orientalis]